MMGYSWSGFNALQVAALRPPALKAIASCFASDDRFADDVHYRGGLVEPMDMVHWSTCMHAWQARPPDPEVVGERWREMWLERLEQPPWIEHWLAHQRRDAYWQNGCVRDAYDQIECAVMCVAGWTDGYNDAALRLMEGLDVPRRALIGPWGHNDPVHGNPGPGGRHPERVRALVGSLAQGHRQRGSTTSPMVVAWMQDSVPPSANLAAATRALGGEQHVAVAAESRRSRSRSATAARGAGVAGADAQRSAASRPSASTAAPGAPTAARPICRSTSARTTPAR